MPAYTLTNWNLATGEGMTYWLMYMYAEDAGIVLAEFQRREGDYMAMGAAVREGFDLDCGEAKLLLSEKARAMIEAGGGNLFYFGTIHVNYS